MALTGSYANDVQYLIEMGENASLANNPSATNIEPQLDSEKRPFIGFGYDLLANRNNILGDLSAAGVTLTTAQQTALTNFLKSNGAAPYTPGQLTQLQGLIWLPTYANAVALMQNSIATAESGLNTLTQSLGIGIIPDSNERAALVDMYYQLPGGGDVKTGKNGYFYNKGGSFTHLSLALQSGNRAAAWFEIRYGSSANGNNGNGVVKRRYVDAQLFGLYANPSSPTETEALQAYQMLTANRAAIMKYELRFGSDPYGSSALTPSKQITNANQDYGLSGTANQVQTLAQVFDAAANQEIEYLTSLYSTVLPSIQLNDTAIGGASSFSVRSVDLYAASATDQSVNASVSDAPGSEAASDASADHILLGSETGDKLIGGLGSDILIAQAGNELLETGAGADTLIAANGNDTIQLGYQLSASAQADLLDFVFPASSGSTETIIANNSSGLGQLDVNGSPLGLGLVSSGPGAWTDQNGNTYQFISSTNTLAGYSPGQNNQAVGEMLITLGGQGGNQIDIWGFNLAQAENLTSGFLGIQVPPTISLTSSANAGVDPPAPNFTAGSTQSYTVWLDAPSTSVETITVTLSGAPASDFGLVSGSSIVPINSNGTFTVTIAAGQTSAAFSLVNTGDVGAAANLQLVASMTNPDDSAGQAISSTPVTQNYVEPSLDPFKNNATTTVSGSPTTDTGGFSYNQYTGGGVSGQSDQIILSSGNNYVVEGVENDFITESAAGTNIILGTSVTSSNDILLNGASTVALAIAQEASDTTPSGQRGDVVATGAGDDTIVGGNGNSLYLVGQGNNVIYTGAGNDSIVGSYYGPSNGYPTQPGNYANQFNWTTSLTEGGQTSFTYGNTTVAVPAYDFIANDLYFTGSSTVPAGAGSDTVVAGNGNDLIALYGSNNYVVAGSGLNTIVGGFGDNTIFGGAGASTIEGGAGNNYIDTGTGNDLVEGNGANDTIIGGSGNDTIFASTPTEYSSGGTGSNYVDGGLGNDVIFGGSGSDTLIAGNGNSTVFGGSGTESIVGGSGNDSLQGGTGSDTIEAGGSGNDTLIAVGSSSSTTYMYGGTGSDVIEGGAGANILYAGDGGTAATPTFVYADQQDASATTTIYGGLGVDQLTGGPGSAVIYAGDGGTAAAPTVVIAGSGNTTVYGGLGVDNIQGGSGTDVLYAGDGGDDSNPTTVIGGSGTATLYGGSGAAVLEDTSGGSDQLIAGSGDDTLIGSGADTLTAGSGADTLFAASGNETYDFGTGFSDDFVSQSGGTANFAFGTGIADTDLSITAALSTTGQALLEIDDGGAIDVAGGLTGAVGSVNFASGSTYSLEQLIGGNGIGDGVDQTLQGASGVLTFSVDNNATLTTGAGADTVSAWGSDDTIGVAQIDDAGSTVFAGGNYSQIFGGSGADSLTAAGYDDSITAGSGNQVLVASNYYDVLTGGSGQDSLTATGKGDTLVAGTGIDTLIDGTGGADTFVVNNTGDVVQANSASANDTVEASASFVLPVNVDALILEGSSNLTGTGNTDSSNLIEANAGNDSLIAGTGSDTLIGGSGNDTLVAGSGSDVLEGGAGSTTYVLDSGFGRTEIQPGSGTGVIQFGTGISANDLTLGLTTDSNGNPALLIQDGSSNVTVDGALSGSINQFEFADGTQLTLAGLLANANVAPGSIVGASGDAIINTSTATSLSGSGNDTVLATGASDTLTAGAGTESLLASGNDASIIGGSGNETLIGAGTGDTVIAGNGSQELYGLGTADVLVGGLGDDTLHGSTGSDELVAGTGNTVMYGGAGADSIMLTAGGTVTFNPSITSTTELINLPVGMTLTDFTAEQGTNGDLILQSTSGNTTAIIKGFYNGSSGTLWMIADSTGAAEPLSQWLDSLQIQPPSGYGQEIADLQQAYAANLTATLNQIGQQGGTLEQPYLSAPQGPGDQYQFNGISTQDVTVQGGVATIVGSDNDQTTTTYTQTGTDTYVVTTPTYGEVTIPGWEQFIPDSSLTQQQIEAMDNEQSNNGLQGPSVTPTTNASGEPGFEIIQLPSTEYVQTGATTTVETVPVNTLFFQGTQSFAVYNITGDGGNDFITAGTGTALNSDTSPNQGGYISGEMDAGFVGTVDTGNGNVSINLGMNNNNVVDGTSFSYPGTPLSPGAFIDAGSGDDLIVGTGGADVIAAGTGFDQILAGFGSTVYVPLEGNSTEDIYIQGPYYGGAPVPQSTLVLPTGITPQDLQYRLITNVPNQDPGDFSLGSGGEELQITYGNSTVLLPFGFNAGNNLYPQPPGDDADGIDRFQFSDGTVLTRDQIIAMAGTPVVSDFNPNTMGSTTDVGAGQSISASLLFGVSDTTGNSVTWYQISNTGTGGGYFELNGVAQPVAHTFMINAGQLDTLQYIAGTSGTSDSIQVSAFDGAVWSQIASSAVNATTGNFFEASGANQTVSGSTTGPDTLVGGYGGDTLIGASGQDTFEYAVGSGAEVISDTAPVTASSNNVLSFGVGITSSSLTLSAAAGGELVLSTGGIGDSVAITGFDPLNPLQSLPIQSFTFGDGTSFTLLQLLGDSAVTGTSGSIDNADGSVTKYGFTPSGQQIYSAQSINASGQVTASVAVNADGSEVTSAYTYNANGSSDVSDTIIGNSNNETLTGSASSDLLEAGTGNQLLVGGSGNETYAFGTGFGQDTITANVTAASNTITFDGAITASDVTFSTDGTNLIITVVGSTGADGQPSTITLPNHYVNGQPVTDIGQIVFGDGSTISMTQVNQALAASSVLAGTSVQVLSTGISITAPNSTDTLTADNGNDTLNGSSGADTLVAGAGNDIFNGGSGSQTYVFGSGFGQDTVVANGTAVSNTITFTNAIASDVTFSTNGTNLTITVAGSTGADGQPSTITLPDHYVNGQPVNDIGEIVFGDGTTVSMTQVNQLLSESAADTIAVPDSSSTVAGSGNEVFNLGADDTLTLGSGTDTVNASSGFDNILLGTGTAQITTGNTTNYFEADAGFGNTTIAGTATNTYGNQSDLTFGLGILPQDIDVQQQSNDLVLTDTLTGNSIDFSGWYSNPHSELTQISFADGSTWYPAWFSPSQPFGEDLYASVGNESLVGNSGNDTLNSDNGTDTLVAGTGATTLIGGSGTDLLVAGTGTNTMEGGTGTETYAFAPGFGDTYIATSSTEQGSNTIQFAAGIAASQLSYSQRGLNLVITVAEANGSGSSSTITLANYFLDSNSISGLTFADGSTVTAAQINQQFSEFAPGTTGTLQVVPFAAGDDTLTSDNGNDTLVSNSLGSATTLVGGSGTDLLVAGIGYNELDGGTGAETYEINPGGNTTPMLGGINGSVGQTLIQTNATENGADILAFNGNISPSELVFQQNGTALEIGITTGSNFEEVQVNNYFGANGEPSGNIQGLTFADGETLSLASVNAKLASASGRAFQLTPDGTEIYDAQVWYPNSVTDGASGDTVTPTQSNVTIVGGTGNDVISLEPGDNFTLGTGTAQVNAGFADVTYEANEGFGNATITGTATNASNQSDLNFGAGILPQDIAIAQQGNNLLLTDTLSGHSIDFSGWYSNSTSELSQINFADGSVWEPVSVSPAQPFNEDLYASAGNESLVGTAGNDTLNSDNGNDTLVGGTGASTLIGGAGTDLMVAGTGTNMMQDRAGPGTFEFGEGFGETTIEAGTSTSSNTIQFLTGITASQLSYAQDGSNLVISVAESNGDTGTITVANHFVDGSPLPNDVSELTFADGTSVTMAQINQQFSTSESVGETTMNTKSLVAEPAATSPNTAIDKSKTASSADAKLAPSDVPKLVMQADSSIAGNLTTSGKNRLASRGLNGSAMPNTPTIGGSNQNASSNDAPTAASDVQPSANGNESQQSSILVGNPGLRAGLAISPDPGNSGNATAPNDPIDGDPNDATIWAPENRSGSVGSQVAGAAPRYNDTSIGQAMPSTPRGRGMRLGRTANAANEMIKALSAQGNIQELGKAENKSQTASVQLQDGTLWSLSTLDRTMAALSPEAVQSARTAVGNSAFGSADLAHAQLVEAMASFSPEASAESSLPPTGSEAYAITVAAQMH